MIRGIQQVKWKRVLHMNLLAPLCVLWFSLFSLAASAEEVNEQCATALQRGAYSDYLISIDQARVEQIQQALVRLSSSESDSDGTAAQSLPVDGVLGVATREALYRFCLGLKSAPESNFVVNLVQKLDQQVALLSAVANTLSDEQGAAEDVVETPVAEPVVVVSPPQKKNVLSEVIEPESEMLEGQPSLWYQLSKDDLTAITEAVAAQLAEQEKAAAAETEENNEKEESNEGAADSTQPVEIVPLPSEEALASLEKIIDIPYANRSLFQRAVSAEVGIDQRQYPQFSKQLADRAQKIASSKLTPIVLDDDDCGCVRNFSDNVYGFYPYWRATQARNSEEGVEAAQPLPAIDYSIYNRIAYYALTLEESGEITTPLHWNSGGKLGNFINKAHRHKTAVDLVIYSNHWSQWKDNTLQASVMSVYNQLLLKVEYKESGVMAYVPFLNKTVASPDGVTLYFDGYFENRASRYKIVEFVSQLYERLEDLDRDYRINILLDTSSTELEGTEDLFKDLKPLLVSDQAEIPSYVDSLLLFLDEPTTDAKKILRSKIEDEFSGAQRMAVLRKVIPVISPYGHENDARGPYRQFDDDLIYLKNNFSGVALWPLPMASDADAEMVTQRVIENFGMDDVEGLLNTLSDRFPELCEYACPNRRVFRYGIDLLLVVAIAYGVLALFSSRMRRFYNRNKRFFVLYLVIVMAVFMVSLMCDPFWKQRRDVVLATSVLIAAAVFMVRKYSQAKQGPLP